MEPVTSSGDASFPPPPIFKSAKTPITRSTAVTRLTSNLLPLELIQGTAKSLRIAKDPSPKSGDPTMLPLNSLLEIASAFHPTGCSTLRPRIQGYAKRERFLLCSAGSPFKRLRDLSYRCFLTSKSLQFADIIFGSFAPFRHLGHLNS